MNNLAKLLLVSPALFMFPACENFQNTDDLVDPGQYSPPDQHPQCSIASFYLSSASYTSAHGGFFDYTLVLQNAPNAESAVNIRGDFVARTSDGIVGETSVAFDQLDGGQSETGYVQLELTRPPEEVDCTISWTDIYGASYSVQGVADNMGIFPAAEKTPMMMNKMWRSTTSGAH